MTMPTHHQTADALDATIRAMHNDPSLDADQAARLVTLGRADRPMPHGDTASSLLKEAITDAIEDAHAPHLDADDRDRAHQLHRDVALSAAHAAAERFHSYR